LSKPKGSKNTSIQAFLDQKAKQRIQAIAEPLETSLPQEAPEVKGPIPIFTVPAAIAKAALDGFIPFANDLPKQERYKSFLANIIERQEKLEQDPHVPLPDLKLSTNEALETREFAKAAMVFQPMSKMISSRFQNEGSETIVRDTKVRVFGKNTRTTTKWRPEKVLCRRFGVGWKQYYEDDDEDDDEDEKKVILNKDTMEKLVEERDRLLQIGQVPSLAADIQVEETAVMEVDVADDANAVSDQKPSLDLFKAIFADSSDDESKQGNVMEPAVMEPGPSFLEVEHPNASASIVEQPFRPVFTKPTRKEPLNQRRKKKTRPAPIVETSSEDRVVKRKFAADYMD
jgi:G patch domain-containing protein 1